MNYLNTNVELLPFNEKALYLLHYIYHNGGSEYKPMSLNSDGAYCIAGCQSPDQFNRVMKSLQSKGLLEIGDIQLSPIDHSKNIPRITFYNYIQLTQAGFKQVEKDQPRIPMYGLVTQEITTGNVDTDAKINHARQLFFSEPVTMDNMRSACETLSFVLEPLRKDLKTVIADGDVEHFFQLVNKFDIRHNNDYTKNIEYSEQLEWVFYSLLNTINTYTKLRNRLKT